MPEYRGRLLSEQEVLAEDVFFCIEIHPGRGRLYSWDGYLELPCEHGFSFADHRTCEIELDDGRRGQITLTGLNGMAVVFQGTGTLE